VSKYTRVGGQASETFGLMEVKDKGGPAGEGTLNLVEQAFGKVGDHRTGG